MNNKKELLQQISSLKSSIKVKLHEEKVLIDHFSKMDKTSLDESILTLKSLIKLKNELFDLTKEDLNKDQQKEFFIEVLSLYEHLSAAQSVSMGIVS